ncbi:MAG: glycosyltransferase family 2 protein, partial [Agathobacter sp.]
MTKISVIIPVYNAEKTIRRCLESIMSSKYEDYEVIVVDDGSTDNSAAILFEYANRDHRVKIINQPNSGPSIARNKGLELAEGEIIAFVDSDDYVRNDYLEQLEKAFREHRADVVFFEYHRVMHDGTELSTHYLPEIQTEYYQSLIALSEVDMFGYTWVKAFRRELSREVCFDAEVNLFEDELFTCRLLEKPVKLYFLNDAIYYYVRTNGTLAQRTHEDYCKLCDRVFLA